MKLLDELIFEKYSKSFHRKFSMPVETIEYHPHYEDVMGWILQNHAKLSNDDDEMQGQCKLLAQFHWAREYFAAAPVPLTKGRPNGDRRRWIDGRLDEGDVLSGDIPWRSFHQDDWPCSECNHLPSEHYWERRDRFGEPTDGFECSKCNCGNNSR